MRLLRNYSDCFFLLCISFYILFFWFVEGAEATQNSTKSAIEGLFRGGKEYNLIYARLVGCAVQQDTRCFVDVAEDFLENKRNELLECATHLIMARRYLSNKELQEIANDPTFFDDLPTPDNPKMIWMKEKSKSRTMIMTADLNTNMIRGGRADSTNSPSQLAKSIEKIIFELSSLFKNGLGGLLSPRDGEEELEDEEDSVEETKDGVSSRGSGKQAKQGK
nr:unnamed protein product [Callosobruchus analis]